MNYIIHLENTQIHDGRCNTKLQWYEYLLVRTNTPLTAHHKHTPHTRAHAHTTKHTLGTTRLYGVQWWLPHGAHPRSQGQTPDLLSKPVTSFRGLNTRIARREGWSNFSIKRAKRLKSERRDGHILIGIGVIYRMLCHIMSHLNGVKITYRE